MVVMIVLQVIVQTLHTRALGNLSLDKVVLRVGPTAFNPRFGFSLNGHV